MGIFTDRSVASTDANDDGNIGGELLRRFDVTFDYGHQRMYLRPNANYGSAFEFDQSGMWINQVDNAFVIKSVMPGGPAEQAGPKVGERITEVDGQIASDIGLANFRELLRGSTLGTDLRLRVDDGRTPRNVTLVLRQLIPDAAERP